MERRRVVRRVGREKMGKGINGIDRLGRGLEGTE